MSYSYVKHKPPLRSNPSSGQIVATSSILFWRRPLAILLFTIGIYFLYSAFWPMLSFQITYGHKFQPVVSPLSATFYNRSGNILGQTNQDDFTQLDSWFVGQKNLENPSSAIEGLQTYNISVPKLKIDKAVVNYGSMDLKKSLIQYPQTALPGQLGNAVIFGHSVLPQFFNPKSYITIFSTLYKLKTGDEIFVEYDSVKYKYLVDEIYEVKPTDLSVLEQRFDNRYLTLITCTPPGTYLRRLVVKTRLADL